MARRKRFKGLEATLKNLQNATTGAFDPASLPAGSIIKNYTDFKLGVRKIDITRSPESLPGELVAKVVIPFSVLNADGGHVIVASKRAVDALGSLGPSATDLNLDDVTVETPRAGFIPAKAIIFKSGTQVPTLEESQITGRRYNPREGVSYTLPFGQKTGGTTAPDITYAGVAAGIRAALGAGENVSFEPEYFPMGR